MTSDTSEGHRTDSGIVRFLTFVYCLVAYVFFLISFLYAIGFVGNLIVPKGIDTGPRAATIGALVVDLALLSAFAIQHSVMARPSFKRWWTRMIPSAAERSTYVLATSLVLLLLFWQWRPMPERIWNVGNAAVHLAIWVVFWVGWGVVLVSTFLIDHFDLFGLRQVYFFAAGRRYTSPRFQTVGFYRVVRHPIMTGFVIAFWATPTMTYGHLLFAAVSTLYILAAIQLEERDLLASHGSEYASYRKRVRMLLPFPGSRPSDQLPG